MEIFTSRRIANMGVMAALYVVLTLMCAPLAYNDVQFRLSEMLILLCYFNKDHVISMTLGCFIANLFSPMGFIDAGFGTAATLIAALLIYITRDKVNLLVASLFPVVTNGLIVAAELKIVNGFPYWPSALSVAAGEFVCVSVLGVMIFMLIRRNRKVMKLITSGNSSER